MIILGVVFLAIITQASALPCELGVTLINQDPYPAIPNDYVEVVFQVSGVENPECEGVQLEFVEKFPFSVQGESIRMLDGTTYTRDYKTEWMVPYKLIVDKDTLDGDKEIEVKFSSKQNPNAQKEEFTIKVEDSRSDFEIYVKEYSYQTKEVTFEILNIGDVDVEALTVEIPRQENIEVSGANRVVVGDLDSNEYTSADFTADLQDGELQVTILYTDQIDIRRSLDKVVTFDSSYFKATIEQKSTPWTTYAVVLAVIALIVWWITHRKKKKKERELRRRGMAKL